MPLVSESVGAKKIWPSFGRFDVGERYRIKQEGLLDGRRGTKVPGNFLQSTTFRTLFIGGLVAAELMRSLACNEVLPIHQAVHDADQVRQGFFTFLSSSNPIMLKCEESSNIILATRAELHPQNRTDGFLAQGSPMQHDGQSCQNCHD
ncbi:unnamed protein product [Sphagnum troendelagicum]|uniref:Uncharacterized protein n=1 Tax=Sphagnum troendelagicum TaxID=128251 RepID=A0ABP0TUA2_9BRYO